MRAGDRNSGQRGSTQNHKQRENYGKKVIEGSRLNLTGVFTGQQGQRSWRVLVSPRARTPISVITGRQLHTCCVPLGSIAETQLLCLRLTFMLNTQRQ